MSKPRKQYNPRRWQRVAWAGGADQIQRTLNLASTERLRAEEIDRIDLTLIGSLLIMQDGFCPVAYNMLTHTYRVARVIADDMRVHGLSLRCTQAWDVLHTLYETPGNPALSLDQYAILDELRAALVTLLPEVPRPEWDMAQASSREQLQENMMATFSTMPKWAHEGMLSIMAGQTVAALAKQLGMPQSVVSGHIRAAAAVVHCLHPDKGVPFPSSITMLRQHGLAMRPTAEHLCHVVNQLSGRAA